MVAMRSSTVLAPTGVLFEEEYQLPTVKYSGKEEKTTKEEKNQPENRISWENVYYLGYMHLAGIYGIYLMFTSAKIQTTIFALALYKLCTMGITAGVHRLWTHRSYKATWQLRVILMVLDTISYQKSIYMWVRDHRTHHKYTETDADPYNAKRGFFFSQIGWICCRKHSQVKEKGKEIDMTDIKEDAIVMFQHKYYNFLLPLLCHILPTITPMYLWGETFSNSWHIAVAFRHMFHLNMTGLVNSAAHMWGYRPYDKSMGPSENLTVTMMASGEGWHNFHHVFPWDYKIGELGDYGTNFGTMFIDLFAKIGWAYDRKTVSQAMIEKRAERTGDGSHISCIKKQRVKDLSEKVYDQNGKAKILH